jgi:hypothetical protein
MNNSNRTFQVGFRYYNEIGVEWISTKRLIIT